MRETLKEKEVLRMALAGTWGRMLVSFSMTGNPRGQVALEQGE